MNEGTCHVHDAFGRLPCRQHAISAILSRQPNCFENARNGGICAKKKVIPFHTPLPRREISCASDLGMRITRLLAAALLLVALVAAGAGAQEAAVEGVGPEEIAAKAKAKEEAVLAAELGLLRAKISALELSIAEQTQELKSKDDGIEKLEKVIVEKSQKIATLQSEITSLQAKGSIAAEEQAGKANARAIELVELEKQDIAAQNNKKVTLEARAGDAEKKVQELNAKLERVHGAWLPPWLAPHAARSMEVMSSHWNEHGKPAVNSLLQKASEKLVQAKEWAKPHIETAKAKWIPVIKEKWVIAKTNTEPYVQMASAKSIEVYQASKDAIIPHVVKAHEFADPYFQEAKKLSKPYIDQVAKASKPHAQKIRTTLKPYTKRAGHAYEKFLDTATYYHQQAQATILDYMHQHELAKQFATEELVWFLASSLLAMPVYVLYILLVETFCSKKQKKSPRNGNANHGHRRHKRRHADKETIHKHFVFVSGLPL